ncbi:MAG: LytTR family DNA-binding domain-containing protein, partial [Variovorax sp.]
DPAEPWIWELSSAASLMVCFWALLVFDDMLRARVRNGWARLGIYAIASVVFSVAHVAAMVALRHLVYRLAGWHYDFGPWLDGLGYEYRKDVLTFIVMLVGMTVWRRLASRTVSATPAVPAAEAATVGPAPAPTFLVRTNRGDVLVRTPEIDWVEAQGNYVALHVQGQALLMRQTLAELEAQLAAHGFIRTHRGALVNASRVQAIIARGDSELGVRLTNGEVAPLSESRRAGVVQRVVGAL